MATIRIKNNNNEWESVAIGNIKASVEPIVLTGYCNYVCSNVIASKYIELYGNTISTKDLVDVENLFYKYKNKTIPFDINLGDYVTNNFNNMFSYAINLVELPKINNVNVSSIQLMFSNCRMLREIPKDWCDNWSWSKIDGYNSTYAGGSQSQAFNNCFSLRIIPAALISHGNRYIYDLGSLYYSGFTNCYVLDEIIDIIVYDKATWTSNAFISTVSSCNRLKNFTFETNEDGTPKTVKWTNQTIDLATRVGYATGTGGNIIYYNSGITADKEVKDDATYQALKNDPDWFTINIAYSRYNHDSAVATINSLPDTSAYLATAGGTNTIKFQGACGSLTDGGAINTLTEEEIAVAAAKGWTVSLV